MIITGTGISEQCILANILRKAARAFPSHAASKRRINQPANRPDYNAGFVAGYRRALSDVSRTIDNGGNKRL